MIPVILALASAVAVGPQPLPGMTVDRPDYPISALRMGRQGRVVYHVAVDAGGIPHDCRVTISVDAELDQRTCELVSARLRFVPGQSKTGVAIESEYSGALRWAIKSRSPLADHTNVVTMTLAADGTIERCTAEQDGTQSALSTTDCRTNVGANLAEFVSDDLSQIATVTYVTTQRTAGPVAPPMERFGSLRTSISVDWAVKADGSVGDCLVVENSVPVGTVEDPCSRFAEYLHAPYEAAPDDKPRGVGFGIYVLAQPRVTGASIRP